MPSLFFWQKSQDNAGRTHSTSKQTTANLFIIDCLSNYFIAKIGKHFYIRNFGGNIFTKKFTKTVDVAYNAGMRYFFHRDKSFRPSRIKKWRFRRGRDRPFGVTEKISAERGDNVCIIRQSLPYTDRINLKS